MKYKMLITQITMNNKILRLKLKSMTQHIVELQKEKGELTDRCRELEGKLTKVREEIIKALKECTDDEWLPAHNGKARYVYLQSVIDIVIEKFEETDN